MESIFARGLARNDLVVGIAEQIGSSARSSPGLSDSLSRKVRTNLHSIFQPFRGRS